MAKYIVQHRRGTASEWSSHSTIKPKAGELVIEIDEVNSLHKLKIGDGIHTYAELAYLQAGDDTVTQTLSKIKPRVVTIELTENWTQDPNIEGKYSQTIELDNITTQSRLDLHPSADMLAEFQNLNLVFVTENKNGVITVHSVGDKPLKEYTMQATIIETEPYDDCDNIVGIQAGTPLVKPDWGQEDETKADYIKNKPTFGTLAYKNGVAMEDLDGDVHESIGILTNYVTPQMFGAVGDGETDDLDAFKDALSSSNDIDKNYSVTVFVPKGTYALYDTLEISNYKTLILDNGVKLIKPASAGTNTPVVRIKGNYNSILGNGMTNSQIISKCATPSGVLCIGDLSMGVEEPISAMYNTITNIGVIGHQTGGNTEGTASHAVYICCSDGYSKAVYFNTLQNMYISNANNGLILEGFANANIIENIQFYHVGDEKHLDGAAIHLKSHKYTNKNGEEKEKYPLENIISNVFHHASTNAITTFIDGYCIYNSLQSIVSEQGGSGAIGIKNNDDRTNGFNITMTENTATGNSVTENFYTKNNVIRRNAATFPNVKTRAVNAETVDAVAVSADTVECSENILSNNISTVKSGAIFHNNMSEAKTYVLLAVKPNSLAKYYSCSVNVEFTVKSGQIGANFAAKYVNATYLIHVDASGNITIIPKTETVGNKILAVGLDKEGRVCVCVKIQNYTNNGAVQDISVHGKYRFVGIGKYYELSVPSDNEELDVDTPLPFVAKSDIQHIKSGETSSRPTNNLNCGTFYFDTTLGKPMWYNGNEWIDASNGAVDQLSTEIANQQAIVDSSVLFTAQTITDVQKEQARENIGAASVKETNQLSEDLAKYGTLTLGIHTDGLVYIFKDGSPIGTGVQVGSNGDVTGNLDSENNIILSGNLADGTYTLKWLKKDGTYADAGSIEVGDIPEPEPEKTNFAGTLTVGRLSNSATGNVTSGDAPTTRTTEFVSVANGDIVYVSGYTAGTNGISFMTFDSSKTRIGSLTGTSASFVSNYATLQEYTDTSATVEITSDSVSYVRFSSVPSGAEDDVIVNIKRNGAWL